MTNIIAVIEDGENTMNNFPEKQFITEAGGDSLCRLQIYNYGIRIHSETVTE